MDVNTVAILAQELQNNIVDQINKFQTRTGVRVDDIFVNKVTNVEYKKREEREIANIEETNLIKIVYTFCPKL